MSRHLSQQEIAAWIAGQRPTECETHLPGCEACRQHVENLESALADFRHAVRARSEEIATPPAAMSWRAEARHQWMRWALTAAAIVLIVAGTDYWRTARVRRAAEMARADALLMEQIEFNISRSVPRTMEPLLTLETWTPAATQGNTKKEN